MTERNKEFINDNLKILNPEQVLAIYTASQVGESFSNLLDQVYESRSDRIEGHPAEKFQKKIEENILYPFLVFDGDLPIGCFAAQQFGEKVDMGNAAVLRQYRGRNVGKNIYKVAFDWVDCNLSEKTAIISGGYRLHVSAALGINHCGVFPCWLPPFPSWGYSNEPLEENNGRIHEFLLVGEKYFQECSYAPGQIYIPHDDKSALLISSLWDEYIKWQHSDQNIDYFVSGDEIFHKKFTFTKGDTERVRFEYTPESEEGVYFSEVLVESFNQSGDKKNFDIPVTRGIAIDVPVDYPNASPIQDFLIEKGFIFCGIYPGIKTVDIENPDGTKFVYQRKPYNIYGLLRHGLKEHIRETELPRLDNKELDMVFKEIYMDWIKS